MICACCNSELGNRYHALDRRTVRCEYSGEQPVVTHIVLSSDAIPAWCGSECWGAMSGVQISAMELKYPFPDSGPINPCSICGKPVDCTKPHVSYAVADMELETKPWLTVAKVHEEVTLAVLCPACEAPDFAESTQNREPETNLVCQ